MKGFEGDTVDSSWYLLLTKSSTDIWCWYDWRDNYIGQLSYQRKTLIFHQQFDQILYCRLNFDLRFVEQEKEVDLHIIMNIWWGKCVYFISSASFHLWYWWTVSKRGDPNVMSSGNLHSCTIQVPLTLLN